MVLNAICSVLWLWSPVSPGTLVQSWKEFLPYLEDHDLHGFPNK
jgi:hypothetical protein